MNLNLTTKQVKKLYRNIQDTLEDFYKHFDRVSAFELGSLNIDDEHPNYDEIMREADEEKDRWEAKCEWIAKKLDLKIESLLKLHEVPEVTAYYKEKVKPIFADKKSILSGTYHEEFHEISSTLYYRVLSFLEIFDHYEAKKVEEKSPQDKTERIEILENILKNTAYIIKSNNFPVPKSEPGIYKKVKPILYLHFPQLIETKGHAFFKALKTYKPDIMIPECGVAVEYKYVKTEEDLKKVIGELSEDVNVYGDELYKLFYAVFYVKDSKLGPQKRLEHFWTEKKFPKHWRCVFCFE